MATDSELYSWANAGMADFISFEPGGQVRVVISNNLHDISVGDNVFEKLPVLAGFEDLFSDEAIRLKPVALEGVVLAGYPADFPIDFRLGVDANGEAGLLLAMPNISHFGQTARLKQEKRKRLYLENLLENERIRFEEIYQQSPVSAFALSENEDLLAMTEQLRLWLGEQTDAAQWVQEFCLMHKPIWRELLSNGLGKTGFRSGVSIAGQDIVIVDVSVMTMQSQNDGVETFIALQDVTQITSAMTSIKRQQAQIAEAAALLETSNRRLEQFAHVAAHDLLGPLGRMSSFSDIIEMELGNDIEGMLATAVDAIRISARESIELVQDLLTLAKLQYFEPDYEEIDLKSVISSLHQGLLAGMSVEFAFKGATSLIADRRLLQLILRNLISNSHKYRDHGRQLLICFDLQEEDDGQLQLSIIDNGSGFDDKGVDPFAAFQRMREHGAIQGTGLGLAMVKDAADSMGWLAGISSQRGQGTRLIFSGIKREIN